MPRRAWLSRAITTSLTFQLDWIDAAVEAEIERLTELAPLHSGVRKALGGVK